MKTLILQNPLTIIQQQQQQQKPIFLFNFPSFYREKIATIPLISRQERYPLLKTSAFSGWDEFRPGESSVESNRLGEFLVSVGIDDKKHVFMFLLGLVSAFVISRIRVSSIVVFPACVVVFGVGFLVGFVRGGHFGEIGGVGNVSKKKAKDENFQDYVERLKGLLVFFDGLDGKVRNLESDVKRAIDSEEIGMSDLESYVSAIESIKASALDARNVFEVTIGGGNENKKSSSRKGKETSKVGEGFLQFVSGLFGEKVASSRLSKVKEKDNVKQSSVEGLDDDKFQGISFPSAYGEGLLDARSDDRANGALRNDQGLTGKSSLDWARKRKIRITSKNDDFESDHAVGSERRILDSEEGYDYVNTRLRFVNNRHISLEMDQNKEIAHGNLRDSVDFRVRLKHVETEASFVEEQMFAKYSEFYSSSRDRKMNEDDLYQSQCTEDRASSAFDDLGSSSSAISDDVFDRYLTEANSLLKEAKECIRSRKKEGHAEIVLYKSAKLLNQAISMKPMSLLAVGQLGNTYLLHGKLKLKISREIRTILSRRDHLSDGSRIRIFGGLDDQLLNKDKVASFLVDVCEECEELLVEAGRKYRLALSIDGNDVRALYNWGLALSFRAQLIADIGPEAAFDADKVFLAAIDKFNAIMSKGNAYLPDALFRWGVTLQQRSRLRPARSKERVKLLEQAKRLYADALRMDSDNFQVREALSSCISELNHRLR